MIWLRRHRGLLFASVATLVAGALTALAYRGQLLTAADIAQAPFGAWDVVLMTAQDPYVIAYFLWPVLTVVLGIVVFLMLDRARALVARLVEALGPGPDRGFDHFIAGLVRLS